MFYHLAWMAAYTFFTASAGRGNALFQFFKPVQDNIDLKRLPLVGFGLSTSKHNEELVAVRSDVIVPWAANLLHDAFYGKRRRFAKRKSAVRPHVDSE